MTEPAYFRPVEPDPTLLSVDHDIGSVRLSETAGFVICVWRFEAAMSRDQALSLADAIRKLANLTAPPAEEE